MSVCQPLPASVKRLLLSVYRIQHEHAHDADLIEAATEYAHWGIDAELAEDKPWPTMEKRQPPKIPEFEAVRGYILYLAKGGKKDGCDKLLAAQYRVTERTYRSALKRDRKLMSIDPRISLFLFVRFVIDPLLEKARSGDMKARKVLLEILTIFKRQVLRKIDAMPEKKFAVVTRNHRKKRG